MSRFKNLLATDKNIIQKSFVITIVMLLFILAGFAAAFYSSSESKKSLYTVYEKHTISAQRLLSITEKSDDIKYRLMGVVADKLPAVGAQKKIASLFEESQKSWNEFQAKYSPDHLSKDDLETYQKLVKGFPIFKKAIDDAIEFLSKDDKGKLGYFLDEQWPQVITEFINPMKKISQLEVGAIKNTYDNATAKSKKMTLYLGIGMIFVLGVSFYALYFFSKMKISSHHIIDELDNVGSNMFTTAENVRQASESLSEVTTTNKQSIHETSTALEEITAMVMSSAANAEKSKLVADSTTNLARSGGATVQEMLQAIKIISTTTDSMLSQMDETSKNLLKVESIFAMVEQKTRVINDIVFQTKLLSFNASVEAARAGEHGKGFAVVAEEVGKLAEVSGNSAKEISVIINNGSQEISSIINSTKVSLEQLSKIARQRVEEGSEKAENCSVAFSEISNSISEVQSLMAELSSSSEEQNLGISEVNKAMHSINVATDESARLVNNTTEAASEANKQSENLKTILSTLTDMFKGNKAA